MQPRTFFVASVAAAGLGTLLLAACQPDKASNPPVVAQEEANPYAEPVPMREHFEKGLALERALIDGDLEAARGPARWLESWTVGDEVSLEGRAHVTAIKAAAKDVVEATEVRAAAMALGEMARHCGACHQDAGVGIAFTEDDQIEGESTWAHMARHEWAADRLWEGLVGPSDAAWERGATELAEAPLHGPSEDVSAEVQALANRVHGIGASAASQRDPQERAGHFGELLTTCAECHGQVQPAAAERSQVGP